MAERARLQTSALRFYERRGLLPPPMRAAGSRRYDPTVLRRLALIDVAKRAGFTLSEIRDLLENFDDAAPASERWQAFAAAKLEQVEETIRGARAMQRLLREGPFSVRRAGGKWGFPSPFGYRRGPGLTQASLIFDTLVWKDPAGALVPWLAETWQENHDGTEFRFRLRENLRWHDDTALTAADVAFTFEYLRSGAGSTTSVLHRQGLDAVDAVIAEDPHTVVFQLARPYAPFLEWIAGRMLIIPRHVWEPVSDPESFFGPDATLGSGPYRLESCDDGGSYRYVAHQHCVLGTPYVQRLEFVAVTDQLEALAEGQIDAASFISDIHRPSKERLATFPHPEYHLSDRPGEWTRALHLNLTRGYPYDRRSFRHALAHAIDRQALVDHLLDGLGQPASMGGLSPSHPFKQSQLPSYEHEPVRARQLLHDLELVDRGSGFRDLPNGQPFQPTLETDSNDPGAAEMVRARLRDVGIDARLDRLSPQDADRRLITGDYDMALTGYGALGGDPDWLRIRFSRHAAEPTHAKVHGYHNLRFERLADEQAAARDTDHRRTLLAKLQQLIADDLPAIPLYVPNRLELTPTMQVFDAWYFTPGGVWGGYPGSLNKHALVTGRAPHREPPQAPP